MPKTLKEQINKRSPFASPQEEAYLNLMRTAAELSGAESTYFRSLTPRLSPASYNVLRILRGRHTRAESQGARASEIGCEMVVRMPDVTRLVDRLETQALVKRTRDARDKRVVWVAITKKGLALLDRIESDVHETVRTLLAHMTPDELDTLSRLLEKARHPREHEQDPRKDPA